MDQFIQGSGPIGLAVLTGWIAVRSLILVVELFREWLLPRLRRDLRELFSDRSSGGDES